MNNKGSSVENQCRNGNDDRLQSLYLRRLQDFAVPIRGFLDSPLGVFEYFAFQKISDLSRNDEDKKKQMIQRSPLLSQQIAIFFSQVLLKTNFKDLLRVERAFIQHHEVKPKNLDEITSIFGIVADELQQEANETINFRSPREVTISQDSGKQPEEEPPTTPVGEEISIACIQPIPPPRRAVASQLHTVHMVSGTADRLKNFLNKLEEKDRHVWLTKEQDTPLHSAAKSPNTKWAKEATKIVIEWIDENPSKCPLEPEKLIHYQNDKKNTALHLAVENQSCQLARFLLEKGANFLVRNAQSMTPLELMYEKTPQVVIHTLNKAIHSGKKFAQDANLELDIDFRALIGGHKNTTVQDSDEDAGRTISLAPIRPTTSSSEQCSRKQQETQESKAKDQDINGSKSIKIQEGNQGILKYFRCFPRKNRGQDLEMNPLPEQDSLLQPTNIAASSSTQANRNSQDEDETTNLEMDLLAKMVYQNDKNSTSVILSHVIVKTFLELKWKKLRGPIYLLTGIYIFVYLFFNLFAIRTFIAKFPYPITESDATEESASNVYQNVTFLGYLLDILVEPSTGIDFWDANAQNIIDRFLAAVTILLGLLSWFFELYEFRLIKLRTTASGCQAFLSYITNLENVLQCFFASGTIAVASVGFFSEYSLHYWTYWLTAWLVVVSWTLILLQLGNFSVWANYVHIFKTVIKKFSVVMAIYACFLFGFSVAFSITFPQDRFATFSVSFFRSISMMAGELNFDDVFQSNEIRPFPFVTQALYFGFTVTVTIVLINLLTGLAVDDIGKILKDSDVIRRSIQVERLYMLERMLYKWNCKCKSFSDIYVLPLEKRKADDGSLATHKTKINELPEELQLELRLVYAEAWEKHD